MLKILLVGLLCMLVGSALVWMLMKSVGRENCLTSRLAVKNLRYKEMNDRQIKLEWDPPDVKDVVQKYIITVSSDWDDQIGTYNSNNTSYIFLDAHFCTIYTFTVTGHIFTDLGDFASVSLQVHTRHTVPEDPKNLTIDAKNKIINWTATLDDYCVHRFHLKLYYLDMCIKDVVLPRFVHIYNFSDMSHCLQYTVTLQALGINATHSAIVQKEMLSTITDIQSARFIENLRYTIVSLENIVLEWDTLSILSNCVHDYAIIIPNHQMSSLFTTQRANFSITGLNICEEYQIFVAARTIYKEFIGKTAEVTVKTFLQENQVGKLSYGETNGSLIITWMTPVETSNCIELYSLEICAMNAILPCRTFKPNVELDRESATMVVKVPNILPCAIYKVSVSVFTINKRYTFHSDVYKTRPRVFAAPVFRNIHNISSRSAILEWQIADLNINPCKLSSSILECTMDGNSFMSYEFPATLFQENVITEATNLHPYSNYICHLTFNQLFGRSEMSKKIQFTTLEDVPSAVQNVSVGNISSDSFIVSWQTPKFVNGELKAYQVQVRKFHQMYTSPSWCKLETDLIRKITVSTDTCSYQIKNLHPFTEYAVEISASTSVGFGSVAKATAATLPAVAAPVSQLECTSTSPLCYSITWRQPCESNGVLKLFLVMVTGIRDRHPDDTFSYSIMPNTSHPNSIYSVRLPKLRPVYRYRIEISTAIENVPQLGIKKIIEISTPSALPPVPRVEELTRKVQIEPVLGQNGTQYKVTLTRDMFEDSGGEIIYYALIIGQDISLNNKMESNTVDIPREWPSISNWTEASQYNFIFPYQVTPPYWNPFKSLHPTSNEKRIFVIGEDVFCHTSVGGYCNGPLKPETKYVMKIRAFTATGFQDSPPLKFKTGSEIKHIIHSNYLFAILVLSFFGIAAFGLFYVRRRRAIYLYGAVMQRQNDRRKLISKSTSVKKFPELYNKLKESPHILRIEFSELHTLSSQITKSRPNKIATYYNNFKKNRYRNILPYDETRVKINGINGDYINASFIEGAHRTRAYIACQGPLLETLNDFWTMIIQYNISVIVMLCQIIENNQVVCERYFPDVDETLNFDGVTVECTMMTTNIFYEERKIIATNKNERLIVNHIKFSEWQDFDVPTDPEVLVNFCNAVQKLWNGTPIVVHCSAGVGRTGTFIACDILLQQLSTSELINIFDTVLNLRKQRPGMVQSIAQYTYVYDCIFNAISRQDKLQKQKNQVTTIS